MPEYNIGFSETLTDAAKFVVNNGLDSFEVRQAVLYLSLLSCEIILKALLEKAGMSVNKIKVCSHNFDKLLGYFNDCVVKEDVGNRAVWVSACKIRNQPITKSLLTGALLTAENQGASKYPNEIRYGNHIFHYEPKHALKASTAMLSWAHKYWDRIRLSSPSAPLGEICRKD